MSKKPLEPLIPLDDLKKVLTRIAQVPKPIGKAKRKKEAKKGKKNEPLGPQGCVGPSCVNGRRGNGTESLEFIMGEGVFVKSWDVSFAEAYASLRVRVVVT